jgi:hypothetical protein
VVKNGEVYVLLNFRGSIDVFEDLFRKNNHRWDRWRIV